jgi:hypothetical protein
LGKETSNKLQPRCAATRTRVSGSLNLSHELRQHLSGAASLPRTVSCPDAPLLRPVTWIRRGRTFHVTMLGIPHPVIQIRLSVRPVVSVLAETVGGRHVGEVRLHHTFSSPACSWRWSTGKAEPCGTRQQKARNGDVFHLSVLLIQDEV